MRLIPYQSIMEEQFPFMIQIKTDQDVPPDIHAHTYFQICYVLKGACTHIAHGKRAALTRGDLFSIPPMCAHRLETIPGQHAEIVHIDFLPKLLDRRMSGLLDMDSFVDFALIQPFVQFQDRLLPKLNLSAGGRRLVEQLVTEMLEEYTRRPEGYPLIIKSNLQKLLVIAGREFLQYMQVSGEHQLVHLHREHLEQALGYIDAHFRENMKLQDAAAKAVMSPSHFSAVFKLIKGTTFVEYVNEIRLNEAMKLLTEHPDWSVERISEEAGFNHMGHFYRMFKRKLGVTPAQYRSQ